MESRPLSPLSPAESACGHRPRPQAWGLAARASGTCRGGLWPAVINGLKYRVARRAALLPGCFYYTLANGSPALIPSACAAHATADPSALALAPGAPLANAAAPIPAPLLCEPAGKDIPSPVVRLPTADWEALARSSEAYAANAAGAAAVAVAAAATGDRRTVRASPGHLTACGHACLYGAVEATRCARLPYTSVLTNDSQPKHNQTRGAVWRQVSSQRTTPALHFALAHQHWRARRLTTDSRFLFSHTCMHALFLCMVACTLKLDLAARCENRAMLLLEGASHAG